MRSKPFSRNSAFSQLLGRKYNVKGILVLGVFLFLAGCTPRNDTPFTASEAQKKFEEKCLKDFNLHVRTRQVGHTFWVYLPIKTAIFDYEVLKGQSPSGDKDKEQANKNAPPKFLLNYVDGKYQNHLFSFEYDVVDKKKGKEEDYGFNMSYTDSYTKTKYNLYTSIYEIFFNTKAKDTEKAPQFFVVVITDINKGIETRSTFYLQDFMRAMSGDIPNDEYVKRFLEDRKGSPNMIGDEVGSHISYYDIPMDEFLTKQVLNRIRFKFQYSDFPPESNYDNTIITIIADTLRYYQFEDFTNIRLSNLRKNTKYLFDKAQLVNFGEDKPKEIDGKLIHVSFKDGKPEFNEEEFSDQPASSSGEKAVQ